LWNAHNESLHVNVRKEADVVVVGQALGSFEVAGPQQVVDDKAVDPVALPPLQFCGRLVGAAHFLKPTRRDRCASEIARVESRDLEVEEALLEQDGGRLLVAHRLGRLALEGAEAVEQAVDHAVHLVGADARARQHLFQLGRRAADAAALALHALLAQSEPLVQQLVRHHQRGVLQAFQIAHFYRSEQTRSPTTRSLHNISQLTDVSGTSCIVCKQFIYRREMI